MNLYGKIITHSATITVGISALIVAIFSFAVAGPMAKGEDAIAHDPMLYQPNGHYTEYNLTHNIVPEKISSLRFPHKVSEDVTLLKITAGPGSVVSNHFSISKSFAKVHSANGVIKYVCANHNLRTEMVNNLDSYRFVYYVGSKYAYTVDVNAEECAQYGL